MNFSSPASQGSPNARNEGVTAILGPTNTGKTHHAIERMLAHPSGMIGLPLRLLAREVYGRVVARVGADAVALVTGEEKIKPPKPRYWIATAEAMPRDLDLAFVAIDEIQLAADLDRGHVFTDRLLNFRGRFETLLIGASTMGNAINAMLPGTPIVSRPRLSNLTFAGDRKIARLPRRSAIVAFSAEEVYAIAEWIRRQRGGAAVVLGALSPRTRNAQIEMYQNGDVDYIVATDAIGMGLNLDVDHIAFASDTKFDGWQHRRLTYAELGQIAGRAGRHTRDGTFGTTGRCPPFDEDLVQAVETHQFPQVSMLQWRNSALDFSGLDALVASLDRTPERFGLTRAPTADDQIVLELAARDDDVKRHTKTSADVRRLWDVCQIPDYRKVSPAAHLELVLSVFKAVVRGGRISSDWFQRQIDQVDRTDGDIDALAQRIAQVRTWTYIANRPDWLADPEHWQSIARRVEDSLSDALHERLAQRFVDRRTSVLMRRLRENVMLEAEITTTGDVLVEGQHVGQLHGFRFAPDPQAAGEAARALNAAAQKVLAIEIEARALRVNDAVDDAFVLANDGTIRWLGEAVAKLSAGEKILEPRARVIADEQLTGASLENVQKRVDLWLAQHVTKLLGPLLQLEQGEGVEGIARGIGFQIAENLGVLERSKVSGDIRSLTQDDRTAMRKYGVRFGAHHVYLPALLKPAPRALATLLWSLKNTGLEETKGLEDVAHLASSGRTSFPADPAIAKTLYRAAGFRLCGERVVRVDILERLADLIRPAIAYRPGTTPGDPPPGTADGTGFVVTTAMTSLAGCSGESFASILRSLGFSMESRKGPPITVALVPKAATVPVVVAEAAPDEAKAEGDVSEDAAVADTAHDAESSSAEETAPETAEAIAEIAAPVEASVEAAQVDVETAAVEPAVETAPEPASEIAAEAENTETATDTATAETEAVEVLLIEVWKPQRQQPQRNKERRPERKKAPAILWTRKPTPEPAPQAATPATDGVPAEGQAARPAHQHGPRRDQQRDGKPRFEGKRNDGPRQDGQRRDGPRHDGPRNNRNDRGPQNFSSAAPSPRDRKPDPDSPFAKLAALKAELERKPK